MTVGAAGNVSARLGEGMLITATGIRADTTTPDSLVTCNFDGTWQGPLRPSSEWEMHAAIYQVATEAMVIVHAHSDFATALACRGEGLPAFHYALAEFGGDVRCAPYETFGTPALARAAAAAIDGRTACFLANHGMICYGTDIDVALLTAVRLEALARQYLIAATGGTVRLLTDAEMAAARVRYRSYGRQPEVTTAA
jgi:L-fuculose-phosphate aldolase